MEIGQNFEEIITFRLFSNKKKAMADIVTHAKDDNGYKKYDNESHFIRCAIMRLIAIENKHLVIKRGRPKCKQQ